MRKIEIPNNVEVTGRDREGELQNSEVNFKDWLCNYVLTDPKVGKTAQILIMAKELSDKITESENVIELTEEEWTLLATIVSEPTNGYIPAVANQIIPFLKTVLEAPDDD